MRKFALPRPATLIAGLSVLSLLLLAGCEGTTGVPPPSYYHHKEYLTKPHYRVYITTGSGTYGAALSYSMYGFRSAEKAVEEGLKRCREYQAEELDLRTGTADCYVHSIGNIDVSGMTEEQLKKAIDLYKNNSDATNADLIPVKK